MRNAENPLETGPGSESAPRRANELVAELGKITFTEPVLSALVHQAVSRIEGLEVRVVGEGEGKGKGKLGDLAGVFGVGGGRQKRSPGSTSTCRPSSLPSPPPRPRSAAWANGFYPLVLTTS